MSSSTKRCPGCDQHLQLDAYVRDRHRPDGLSTYCRICRNARGQAYREQLRARNATIPPAAKRVCSVCHQELPASAFSRNRSSPDGLSAECRPCRAARERAWRRNNPDAARAKDARKNARLRARRHRDPDYAAKQRARWLAYGRRQRAAISARQKARYHNDPEYRRRLIAYQVRWQRKKREEGQPPTESQSQQILDEVSG